MKVGQKQSVHTNMVGISTDSVGTEGQMPKTETTHIKIATYLENFATQDLASGYG